MKDIERILIGIPWKMGSFDGNKREECPQDLGRVVDANKLIHFSKFEEILYASQNLQIIVKISVSPTQELQMAC